MQIFSTIDPKPHRYGFGEMKTGYRLTRLKYQFQMTE